MCKVITVTNQKGGVGKTTTAINLAAGLSRMVKNVLLVDMDGQANATQGLGVDRKSIKKSIYEVIMEETEPGSVILPTGSEFLDIIPASVNLNGAKVELVSIEDREYRLKKALQCIKDLYDFIIIDSPPSLDLLTVNALTASDSAIIPIQCEYYALEGLGQLINTLSRIKRGLNPTLDIEGVVLTMYDSRTNLSFQVMENIKKHFKGAVYKTVIPRNVRLAEAPSFGKTIFQYDTSSSGMKAYSDLAAEFLGAND
ncbi:MAG: ParA family protein [Elusimicrobia bacterium]|nr:ParA family protein [Elusimicrobiota bacterium]